MDVTLWQWLLGLLIVIIYGVQRFNSPYDTRATTTFLRYYAAQLSYVAAVVFLFVLLAGALTDPRSVYLLLSGGTLPTDVAQEVDSLPGPLLSALFLTALLPSLPVLKNVDHWLKLQFERLGNIPFEVRQLSGRLNRSPFSMVPLLQQEVREEVSAWSDADVASTLAPHDIHTRTERIAALVLTVKKWRDEPRYGHYVEQNQLAVEKINGLYTHVKEALIDEWLALKNAGEPVRAVASIVERRLRDEMAQLQRLLTDFISGGVLQCELSSTARADRIKAIGFTHVDEVRIPLRIDQIAAIVIAIFLSMAAVAMVFAKTRGDPTFDRTFLTIVMVSIIYGVAIVAALYPKSVWLEADAQARGARPYLAYIVSSVIAAVLAFLIALTFKYVLFLELNFPAALEDSLGKWPWLVMSAGVAFIVALAADNYVTDPTRAPRWIRLYEAIGIAIALVLLQWLVQALLESVAGDVAQETARAPRRLLTALCVGLVIGYLVPHMCRQKHIAGKEAIGASKPGSQPA